MAYWICSAAFVSAAGITFAVSHLVTSRSRLQRRLPAGARVSDAVTLIPGDSVGALVGGAFHRRRARHQPEGQQRAEAKIGARGLFQPTCGPALRFFTHMRRHCCAVTGFTELRVAVPRSFDVAFTLAAAASVGVGVLGPDAYLSRRQSWQIAEYRVNFPDLLDLLTVCVTAGLTVEASFERIRDRLARRSRALGLNIGLMGAEMRAGRSSVDALGAFADRLGLDEAASFVAVLRHSVELGGDVATTLREFSEDMRSKRMLLAEKKANELPVKMVVPLALGIFPIILMIVLLPVILKLVRLIG